MIEYAPTPCVFNTVRCAKVVSLPWLADRVSLFTVHADYLGQADYRLTGRRLDGAPVYEFDRVEA